MVGRCSDARRGNCSEREALSVARTVLVADDSPTIQRRASGILSGEGLEVITVSNGVAAIKKLPTVKPRVVLADVSMPGRDGYEVCQFIKQSADLKHVPVVLVFSDDEPYEDARGAQVGADGRIRKPFDPDELVRTVSRWAAKAEAVTASQQVAARPAPAAPEPLTAPTEAEPTPEEAAANESAAESNVSVVPEGIAFEQFATEEPAAAPITEESAPNATLEPETPSERPGEAAETAAPMRLETEAEGEEFSEGRPSFAVAEPELVEQTPAVHEPEEDHLHPHAHPHEHEPSGFFHAPEEIAEPSLSDELMPSSLAAAGDAAAPAAPVTEAEQRPSPTPEILEAIQEAPVIPPEPAVPAASEPGVMAVGGQPVVARPEPESFAAEANPVLAEPEAVPAATPSEPQPVESASEHDLAVEPEPVAVPLSAAPAPPEAAVATPAPAPLDAGQIFAIVHRVVVRMSPPAMPASAIEDIARRVADEIIAELSS